MITKSQFWSPLIQWNQTQHDVLNILKLVDMESTTRARMPSNSAVKNLKFVIQHHKKQMDI